MASGQQEQEAGCGVVVDGVIGSRAVSLRDFRADPANRIVVATALEEHRLVTADQGILEWSGQVRRLSASS